MSGGVLNLSLIIRTIDRSSSVVRRIKTALGSLGDNRGLRALTGYARASGKAMGWAAGEARKLAAWGGAAAGAAITALTFNVFRLGAAFERYGIILENTEGSQAKARKAMAWVTQFAEKTPYELDTVMAAFVKLRAYGIDPTDGALKTLGDTAAGMGKDIMEAVEALADAQTGEFERLKEFGIRGSQAGSMVKLTFVRDGKEMVVSARKNAKDIREALLGIWAGKFGGQMDKQAKGLTGMLSNLSDWWSGFQRRIGDAGVFDYFKGEVEGLLKSLQTPAGLAKANALAKNISDGMISGFKVLKKTASQVDLGKLITDLAKLIAFGASVVTFLGGLGGVLDTLAVMGIAKLGLDIGTLGVGIAALAGIAGGPIVWTIAAVTALAIGAYLLWRNWDKVVGWFKGLWDRIATTFKNGVDAVWNAMPGWMQGLLKGIGKGVAFTFKLLSGGYAHEAAQDYADSKGRPPPPGGRPGPGAPSAGGGAQRAFSNGPALGLPGFQRQSWDGKLTVRLEGDQAARVQSVKSPSNDFDLLVDRGLNLGSA